MGQRFVESLRETQWLSADELERHQRPLIERLVRHAATQTDYYRERLSPIFNGLDRSTAAIDLSQWHKVPILRRTHAVDHVEELKAREVPPDTGSAKAGNSSGSTGRSLPHLRSAIAILATNCTLDRAYEAFDLNLAGSFAFITPDKKGLCRYPEGGRYKGWNQSFPDSNLFVLGIEAEPQEQFEWLERIRPDHLMTYPVMLEELAGIAVEKRSDLKLKTFISTGEILTQSAHDTVVRTFGCDVIDIYGTREIGAIAFQCPVSPAYHICAETVFCEIVDDLGQPTLPGEYGRVVVTALYNYAMPFIRYDVGDYAVASAKPCSCGRGLPTLDRIGGRTRNMFIMPDGSRKRLRGVLVSETAEHLSYRQVQLVQTDVNNVEIKYVPHEDAFPPNIEALTTMLRREFHPAVNVKLVPVAEIARGPGMKLDQFVSLVAT